MTLQEDYEKVRTFVQVEVSVEALAKIMVDKTEVSSLHLDEGEKKNVRCVTKRVFPRPFFRWSVSSGSGTHVVLNYDKVKTCCAQLS